MKTASSDSECGSVPRSRSPSEDEHSDTESDRGIPKPRPRTSLGIRDVPESEKKAHWSACTNPELLLRQRSSSSLSYSSAGSRLLGYQRQRRRPQKPAAEDERPGVASFSRSLRLLGLQPQDLGLKSDVAVPRRRAPTPGPTFHTRVLERSVSVDELKTALQESLDRIDRETLAKAVYEEWYFRKLEDARRKRELQLTEERNAKEKLEKFREEQQRKSEESFFKWREAKVKGCKKDEKKSAKRPSPEVAKPVSQEKADLAFQAWKKEKDKLKQLQIKAKQSELQKMKDKEKARQEKKVDAKATYQAWKQHTEQKLKEQQIEKEMKKRKEEEKRERAKQERVMDASNSFVQWKQIKDNLLKEKANQILPSPEVAKPVSQEKADLAFQAWKKEKDKLKQLQIKAKQSELQKMKDKEKARQEKKVDAKATYQAWKQHTEQKLKEQQIEKEMKKRKEEEKRERAKEERVMDASNSFVQWKQIKDNLLKEKAKQILLGVKEAEEAKRTRQSDRLYEAEQAFEEWLDHVEERETQREKKRSRSVPPWNP